MSENRRIFLKRTGATVASTAVFGGLTSTRAAAASEYDESDAEFNWDDDFVEYGDWFRVGLITMRDINAAAWSVVHFGSEVNDDMRTHMLVASCSAVSYTELLGGGFRGAGSVVGLTADLYGWNDEPRANIMKDQTVVTPRSENGFSTDTSLAELGIDFAIGAYNIPAGAIALADDAWAIVTSPNSEEIWTEFNDRHGIDEDMYLEYQRLKWNNDAWLSNWTKTGCSIPFEVYHPVGETTHQSLSLEVNFGGGPTGGGKKARVIDIGLSDDGVDDLDAFEY